MIRASLVLGSLIALAAVSATARVSISPPSTLDQPTPGTPTTSTGAPGGHMDAASNPDLFKWAVTQGGLVLVVLVVFWTYRRDLQRISAKDAEKLEIMTDLVGETKGAIQASTAQSVATEKSVHRLSRAIEGMNLGRRTTDHDGGGG